ncbi:MAG: cytochrome C, partial [Nocardioidaceae bacterium]
GQGGALTHGKYAPSLGHVSGKHMYEAMLTGPENMPVFSDHTLTRDEKLSIIHYVKATNNEPNPGGFGLGRVGPVSEGLVLWILGIGLCIAATIWITAKRRS